MNVRAVWMTWTTLHPGPDQEFVPSLAVYTPHESHRVEGEADFDFVSRMAVLKATRIKTGADGKPEMVGRKALHEHVPAADIHLVLVSALPKPIMDSSATDAENLARYRMRASYSVTAQGEIVVDEAKARRLFAERAVFDAAKLDMRAAREELRAEQDPAKTAKIRKYRGDITATKAKMIADANAKTLQELIDYGNPWPAKPV